LGTIPADAGTVAPLARAIATDAGASRFGRRSAVTSKTWAIAAADTGSVTADSWSVAAVDAWQGLGTIAADSWAIATTDSRAIAAADAGEWSGLGRRTAYSWERAGAVSAAGEIASTDVAREC
jgi:hypothetical protein